MQKRGRLWLARVSSIPRCAWRTSKTGFRFVGLETSNGLETACERLAYPRREAVCRLAKLKTTIVFEGSVPHNLLALAEASLGIAVIPSVVQTHRYSLRRVGITHRRKPIREPLAIVWDKRRGLPRYAEDFRETLAAHMRERGGTKLG